MLEKTIKQRLQEKNILLMTHIVIGYPSFEASFKIVESMVSAGVDLMELQIPFSEPIADGPVILAANQKALENGATVNRCLQFAQEVTASFDIPFLFMSYFNIPYKFGMPGFIDTMATIGLKGAIIPDLPPEEGQRYLAEMERRALAPILIFSPNTPQQRLQYLAGFARGFVYCVARKGVTGMNTEFSRQLGAYLSRCRSATSLPLALGFGVKSAEDVRFLSGKVEIAVIGTATIRLVENRGVEAVADYISSLR
jgi:tryptophan synthase alpha chain